MTIDAVLGRLAGVRKNGVGWMAKCPHHSDEHPSLSVGVGDLVLDANLRRVTVAAITASTTQTQGQQPLTADVNEVSVVANANDTVTMPPAQAGLTIKIINNGANTLQIFPASGDDATGGVDTGITLAAAGRLILTAYDGTTWENV